MEKMRDKKKSAAKAAVLFLATQKALLL